MRFLRSLLPARIVSSNQFLQVFLQQHVWLVFSRKNLRQMEVLRRGGGGGKTVVFRKRCQRFFLLVFLFFSWYGLSLIRLIVRWIGQTGTLLSWSINFDIVYYMFIKTATSLQNTEASTAVDGTALRSEPSFDFGLLICYCKFQGVIETEFYKNYKLTFACFTAQSKTKHWRFILWTRNDVL